MYQMSYTRLDIPYLVSKLSSYTSNLRVKHLQGITRVLKSLHFTCDYGLHYYSRVIDNLMYLMSYTRLDIAYMVSKLSSYTGNLGVKHLQGITRVLKYLHFIVIMGYTI